MQGMIHSQVGRLPVPPISRRACCDRFDQLAAWTVRVTGGRRGFHLALLAFLAWGASGLYCQFCEAWRTTFFVGTSSVTFLTVLLARNAQIRATKAMQLKLDELIYALERADNGLIESEDRTEKELDQLRGRRRQSLGRPSRIRA